MSGGPPNRQRLLYSGLLPSDSGAQADPQLPRLLRQDLERHLATLASGDDGAVKRSLRALSASAGFAGERELCSALHRIHRRLGEGDPSARDDAATLLAACITRIAGGDPAMKESWPVPPDDLQIRPIHPNVRGQYLAEVNDRLAHIDAALAISDDADAVAQALYRHLHTLKGAASAAGDEPMTWFCHGLEDKVRGAASEDAAAVAAQEMARWRSTLGGLLHEPETTLARLGKTGSVAPDRRPPGLPQDSTDRAFTTIRVRVADIAGVASSLDGLDQTLGSMGALGERTREGLAQVTQLAESLSEALRTIPGSSPPAEAVDAIRRVLSELVFLGRQLTLHGQDMLAVELVLAAGALEARTRLTRLEWTSAAELFSRLETAIASEARRAGREVVVSTRGAEENLERQLAENLIEPCLQLVRNAVAHGIEAPEIRSRSGKETFGTVTLTAARTERHLVIAVEDDGAGVDVAEIRSRAVEAGISPEAPDQPWEGAPLSLLFLAGFSTRRQSDPLAGRGIGLDIARSRIERLGGTIRLTSRARQGFRAQIEVPLAPRPFGGR